MTHSCRVLHVDDDSSYRQVTAEMLESISDDIVVHSVKPMGVRPELRAEPIDCIVSDYEMPERDGLELCESVRGTHPELPFVLLTGRCSEELLDRAITAGVTDYVRKGGSVEHYRDLANRIVDAVAWAQSERRPGDQRHTPHWTARTDGGYSMRSSR